MVVLWLGGGEKVEGELKGGKEDWLEESEEGG